MSKLITKVGTGDSATFPVLNKTQNALFPLYLTVLLNKSEILNSIV